MRCSTPQGWPRLSITLVAMWFLFAGGLAVFPVVFRGLVPPVWLSFPLPYFAAGLVAGRRATSWGVRLPGVAILVLTTAVVFVGVRSGSDLGRLPLVALSLTAALVGGGVAMLGMAWGSKTAQHQTYDEIESIEGKLRREMLQADKTSDDRRSTIDG